MIKTQNEYKRNQFFQQTETAYKTLKYIDYLQIVIFIL